MQTTPAMDAALKGPAPTIFGAIEIDLPSYDLRLLDGAGVVTWGGKTFRGRDATYGVLAAAEDLTDGVGDEAPAFSITLHPDGDAAAADLAAPTMQGSQVSVWFGVVDQLTGAVVPDPMLIFIGELDVPTLSAGPNGRSLDYEIVSVFERFFDNDEGARLSDGFHQSIWPGELGFEFVTGVQETVYWGMEGAPQVVRPGPAPSWSGVPFTGQPWEMFV